MKKIRVGSLTLMLFVPLGTALAEDAVPYDRFVARIGGAYVFNTDTEIRADRTDGILGSSIDLGRDLDVEEESWNPRADITWRFAPNHALELGYYAFEHEGSRPISRDLNFRDQTFTTGTSVDTTWEVELMRLEYLYSFYRNDKVDLGVGIGAYGLGTEASLVAPVLGQSQTADVLAPLPVGAFRLDYNINSKLKFITAVDLFFINQGDYEGSLTDVRFLLEHQTFKHLGFGIGFDRTAIDVEAANEDWTGSITSNWNSALAYAAFKF
jgi:hypothetical protein